MQNNLSSIQSKNHFNPDYSNTKALTSRTAKALGGAVNGGGSGGDVGLWMETNRYIYDGIMNGASDLSPADQQQFMQWWSWSASQLTAASSGFDPLAGGLVNDSGTPNGGAFIPEGAQPGPNGNIVFRTGTACTTYAPTDMPVDVLSDEFTLNVDVKVQDIVVEKTTDTRLNPPVEAIKITVKDPYSTPAETVYFVHEMDAKININTVGGEGVTVPADMANVTVGTYSSEAAADCTQASIEGQPVVDGDGKTVENAKYYEVEMAGDTIDFRALPGGADTNEDHYVYGGANISVPVSSKVDVQGADAPYTGADGKEYDFKVVVTHKDGSTDTFFLVDEPEFQHNINALSGNTTFDNVALTDGDVPEGFGNLTVNGDVSSGTANADYPEDTQPVDGVDAQYWDPKDVGAVYDAPTVTLHPTGSPSAIEIHAQNVNLTLTSMMDEIQQISEPSDSKPYYQIVIKYRDGSTQTILVDKDAKINIDGGKIREDQRVNLAKGPQPITLNGTSEAEAPQSEEDSENLIVANTLANLPGVTMTAEEIYAKAKEKGVSLINLPSDPTDPALVDFLMAIDPQLGTKFNSYAAASGQDQIDLTGAALRDRLIQLLSALYPDKGVTVGDDSDDIKFGGKGYDIFAGNKRGQGLNAVLRLSTSDSQD